MQTPDPRKLRQFPIPVDDPEIKETRIRIMLELSPEMWWLLIFSLAATLYFRSCT